MLFLLNTKWNILSNYNVNLISFVIIIIIYFTFIELHESNDVNTYELNFIGFELLEKNAVF